jgi:brefeldin A-inhibited guanine nucleotide-exchange protein
VEETPEAIASFLLSTPELSKSSIGEYIGEGNQFNIKVMHAFIDSMDFSGFDFVQALRHFLQAFRLPGEAQKIDRMMEKFADRFCELNPTVFAKADTAYTLAFSVIMLNTDQHSSQIKHRMDKAAFIKNNRGINDDGDLPDEFLGAIFDEIHQNEIIMQDDSNLVKMTMGWGAGEANERKRLEIYKKEVSMIQKKTQLLMTGGTRVASPFKVAVNKELVRSMFSTCAWAIMAALSISFEGATDVEEPQNSREPNVADLCLSGFSGAIRIACMFRLETERDAFVTCLAKLTYLSHFYDIRAKNIKAITTLIETAHSLGETLETGWVEVIKSLSLLEKMQMAVLRGETGDVPRHSLDEERKEHHHQHVSKTLEKYVEQVQSQTSLIVIDRIFTTTVQLSAHAIIHFFKAVCQVSLEEVGMTSQGELMPNYGPPRMYLLQKIVEIAHYNINRIRFEWTQIWRVLQPHFNKVACHPNQAVANFAVDSLRQLGVKFLEREELGQFSAQHEFLKSFEYIIKNNQSPAIREMILNSLSQMITARASRIRSGWKSIFVTFVRAAQTDDRMAQSSFQNIQTIFRNYFEDVVAAGGFVDLVACLAECALLPGAGPAHDELVMSSIQMLQSCTKSLIERAEDEVNGKRKPSNVVSTPTKPTLSISSVAITQPHVHIPRINNLPQQAYLLPNGCISEEHFYLSWFPILTAFSRVVTESEGVLVRTHTMEILFETFKACGHLFDTPYWKTISRNIVSPIFEDLSDPDAAASRESNSAVLIHGLRLLVQLVTAHFPLFSKASPSGDTSTLDFMHSSIDRMIDMMVNPDEKLASTGQTCFSQFLMLNASKFDESTWKWVTTKIAQVCQTTLPSELIRCQDPKNHDSNCPPPVIEDALKATEHMPLLSLDSLDFAKTVIKCVIHLELLNTVKDFALATVDGRTSIASMPKDSRDILLQCLYNSYVVARLFNSLTVLRHAIYKRGWVAQLPNLVKQETTSLSSYITLLGSVCSAIDEEQLLKNLSNEILDLFSRFNDLINDPIKSQRDITSWTPVIVTVLKELAEADSLWKKKGALQKQIPQLYQYTVRMTLVDKQELRTAVIDFLEKVGKHFFQGTIN